MFYTRKYKITITVYATAKDEKEANNIAFSKIVRRKWASWDTEEVED